MDLKANEPNRSNWLFVYFVIAMIIGVILMGMDCMCKAVANTKKYSAVTIYNPLKYNFEIEVKCNWDGNKFLFFRKHKIRGKSNTKIKIPDSSKCQIWPIF